MTLIQALALAFLLVVPSARAEDAPTPTPTPTPTVRNALGAVAGGLSGVGLAYRHNFSPDFAIHLGGLGFATQTVAFADLGLQVMPTITRGPSVKLYAPVGAGAFFASSTTGYAAGTSFVLLAGAGLGVEFGWNGPVSVALELPFCVGFELWGGTRFSGFYPIPSISLLFYL